MWRINRLGPIKTAGEYLVILAKFKIGREKNGDRTFLSRPFGIADVFIGQRKHQ